MKASEVPAFLRTSIAKAARAICVSADFRNPVSDDHSGSGEEAVIKACIQAATDPITKPTSVSAAGVELIKRFEGCASLRTDGKFAAYPDPGTGGAPWTIGWGATGRGISKHTVWTQKQCDERLEADLGKYAHEVSQALGDTPRTQAQFDAMVSFHYNTGAIARATLTRKHIEQDHEGAAREFARWNKAGGRTLKGLTRRRAAETQLYRS